MMHIYDDVCSACSKITTEKYSTSFSSAIRLLNKDIQIPIYHIYGFVRFADEIVDSFHDYNKVELLNDFQKETYACIERGISLNPVLHSFQQVVNKYGIEQDLITAFFSSMQSDLNKFSYDDEGYRNYIYGSAEVVGLMCLHVFCKGNKELFSKLKPYAQALGSAFQKINFLRDVKADSENLKRVYFPGVDFKNFTPNMKADIEADIDADFKKSFEGIIMLPKEAQFGVYVAYKYYLALFKKIRNIKPNKLIEKRIRIPDYLKFIIIIKARIRSSLQIL